MGQLWEAFLARAPIKPSKSRFWLRIGRISDELIKAGISDVQA